MKKSKIVITFVFLCAFFLLLGASYFPKRMILYPDELRYLHISDGIFNYGHLMLRSTLYSYTKIMYPLILFPASFFSETEYYTRAISVVNSFLMAFVPVLALFLAREFRLQRKATVFLLATAFLYPDLLYVITFMSENLYIPLGIGIVLLAWKSLELGDDRRKANALAVALGICFYIAYLNKEIGIVFPLSYMVMGAYIHLRKEHFLPWKRVALSVGIFCFLYFAVNSIFFSGMANSYSQQLFFAKASLMESAIYFSKVFMVHLNWTVFAFFVFPLVIPLAYWPSLDSQTRCKYIFVSLCMVFSLAVVSYTVTLYEDYPNLSPREHLRYVSFLFLPYVALGLHALEQGRDKMRYASLAIMVSLFLVMQMFFPAQFTPGSHVDQMMLKYVFVRENIRLIIIAALAVTCWLFYRHARMAVALLASLMLVVSLTNQVKIYKDFRPVYEVSEKVLIAYRDMFRDLDNIKGNVVCIASPTPYDGTTLIDSYPNRVLVNTYGFNGELPYLLVSREADTEQDFSRLGLFKDYNINTTGKELDFSHREFIKRYETGFALYKVMAR